MLIFTLETVVATSTLLGFWACFILIYLHQISICSSPPFFYSIGFSYKPQQICGISDTEMCDHALDHTDGSVLWKEENLGAGREVGCFGSCFCIAMLHSVKQ